MRKIVLTSLGALLLCAQGAFGQIMDIELQRIDLERCSIIDSVNNNWKGNVSVYYYDLDSLGERTKRGHRIFIDGKLNEFAWIAEDNSYWIAGSFFENGNLHHVTMRVEGFYINMIYYHENGFLSANLYYDENELEHGWHLLFDESGKLEQKIFYEHGKELSNELIGQE